MGTSKLSGKPDKMLGVTCGGLASHPGGAAILLVAICYGNRDKLRLCGPLGSCADLTFTYRVKNTVCYTGVFVTKGFVTTGFHCTCINFILWLSPNNSNHKGKLSGARVVKGKIEGLPGVLGNKGTLAKYRREQGNISQFLGTGEQNSKNYSTKTFGKCVGTWEHRAILEGNKGTRTPPPPPGRPSKL